MDKRRGNKEKAKHFSKELLSRINLMVQEHNLKVKRLNNNSDKHPKVQQIVIERGDSKVE